MLKRIFYLAYYFRKLEWKTLKSFTGFVSERSGLSVYQIWFDMIRSSVRYNISLLEYFQFRFYRLRHEDRLAFAGTGYMYEFQLVMNPRASRDSLSNKLIFLDHYRAFVNHQYASLEDLRGNSSVGRQILSNPSGKVVLKHSKGQCGRGVEVLSCMGLTVRQLIDRLERTGNDMIEEFVVQHRDLMNLSASGLNTVRVITQLGRDDKVEFLGARLRISLNSSVDNLAAGNIAAPIDLDTGRVNGRGVFSDITKEDVSIHPLSGVQIVEFQVPYWRQTLEMVKLAALHDKRNRSIGWDVAITDQGPQLIEGNHDWCKLLWQLPAKKGLKPVLDKYLNSHRD